LAQAIRSQQHSNFEMSSDQRRIAWSLIEPAAGGLSERPAMAVVFPRVRPDASAPDADSGPTGAFVRAGHRVMAMDIPCHGERAKEGQPKGLHGICAALAAGHDPFEPFVADAMTAIDACVERGVADSGRIFVAGMSRMGYGALRLAAADRRIGGAVAYAPVVDWRILREFESVKHTPLAASLVLDTWIDQLAGRPVLTVIGESDERVSTACVKAFASRLGAVPWVDSSLSAAGGQPVLAIDPTVEGHAVSPRWMQAGADFLLALAGGRPRQA
jgi:dienelactone hydrolase